MINICVQLTSVKLYLVTGFGINSSIIDRHKIFISKIYIMCLLPIIITRLYYYLQQIIILGR